MRLPTFAVCFVFLAAVMTPLSICCSSPKSNEIVTSSPVDVVSTPSPENTRSVRLEPDELLALQKFAEAYEPKSGREVIPSPPELDAQLTKIIAKVRNSDSRDHEKFIILIFLKLSRFQIEHFKQRYELGRENPLTLEFYRLVDRRDYARAEISLAYLADNYVEKHPELLAYPPIKEEMRKIEVAGKRI